MEALYLEKTTNTATLQSYSTLTKIQKVTDLIHQPVACQIFPISDITQLLGLTNFIEILWLIFFLNKENQLGNQFWQENKI